MTSDETSQDTDCSICLDSFTYMASLDGCMHRYCLHCITKWSNSKAECPLCKRPFQTIFCSVNAYPDLKRFVGLSPQNGPLSRGCRPAVLTRVERQSERQQTPCNSSIAAESTFQLLRERDVIEFQRSLHVCNMWDSSDQRVVSAAFSRHNPTYLQRLFVWVHRELTDLLGPDNCLMGIVQHTIMTCIMNYGLDDSSLLDALCPYLLVCTDHFVHKLLNFARSSLSTELYDQPAEYKHERTMMSTMDSRSLHAEEHILQPLYPQDVVSFRRVMYRMGLYVCSVSDSHQRNLLVPHLSLDFALLQRLMPWVQRELVVLCGSNDSLILALRQMIMQHIMHKMNDATLHMALCLYLLQYTDHFIHELRSFVCSTLSMEAYDQQALYKCPAFRFEEFSKSCSLIITVSEDAHTDTQCVHASCREVDSD